MAKLAPSFTILSIILMLSFCSGSGSRSGGDVDRVPQPRSRWCVAKRGTSEPLLQINIVVACARIDCSPIHEGGACYHPNTYISHASFAMNRYYNRFGGRPADCNFSNTGRVVTRDPSYGNCTYVATR